MGEVVQLRDYQRKDEPKPELPDGEVIYCSPPIRDTAPSEYSAPVNGDCA